MPLKKLRLNVGMLKRPPMLTGWPRNERSRINEASELPKLEPSITRQINIEKNQDIAKKLMNFVDIFTTPL